MTINGKLGMVWRWAGGIKSLVSAAIGMIVMGAIVLPLAQQNRGDILRIQQDDRVMAAAIESVRDETNDLKIEIRWIGLLVCDTHDATTNGLTPSDRILRASIASWCQRAANSFLAAPSLPSPSLKP